MATERSKGLAVVLSPVDVAALVAVLERALVGGTPPLPRDQRRFGQELLAILTRVQDAVVTLTVTPLKPPLDPEGD